MKRWQVTYLGKPFLLYGNTTEEVREKYSSTIDEGSDIIPLLYPQELFDKLTELPVKHTDAKGREYREINCGVGYCIYRISKDERDGCYYDIVQFRRSGGRLVEPCLWSICTAQEFVDDWLREVPYKKCGNIISLKEVKKLCGKTLFRIGKVYVWRDADGYYYVGNSCFWSKHFKERYKNMSQHRDTAIYVWWIEGGYCKSRRSWFESEEHWQEYWKKITAEQPSCAGTLSYEIVKRGYRAVPVEERKLICRLEYMNLERELRSENPDFVAKMWERVNTKFFESDIDCERICREIVRKLI